MLHCHCRPGGGRFVDQHSAPASSTLPLPPSPHPQVLHVAGNGLAELEGLTGCPSLRVLNACANRLTGLKGLARCALLQVHWGPRGRTVGRPSGHGTAVIGR